MMVCKRNGFTLIELAVALVIAGLFAGFFMNMGTTAKPVDCVATTKNQLEVIRGAIQRYATANDKLPLPARRYVGVDSPLYGVSVDSVSSNDIKQNDGGTTESVYGALPFRALGLDPSFAADCWGNKFSYVVSSDLVADDSLLDPTIPGTITILKNRANTSGIILNEAAYAVISHGANGLGAVKANYSGDNTTQMWLTDSGTTQEAHNAHTNDSILVDAPYNDGKDAGNAFFDDLILYEGKPLRKVDGVCGTADGGGPYPNTKVFDATELCTSGVADETPPDAAGKFYWDCKGLNGGNTLGCDADKLTGPPIDGQCGNIIGPIPLALPLTHPSLCAEGTAVGLPSSGVEQRWKCVSTSGGNESPPCQVAIVAGAPADGQCGSADGSTIAAALPANDPNLCNQGSAFAIITTSTEQRWRCSGMNGGSNSSPCLANISAVCADPGDYTYDNGNSCWIFTPSPSGAECKGDRAPECVARNCNWVSTSVLWTGAPMAAANAYCSSLVSCSTSPNAGNMPVGTRCCATVVPNSPGEWYVYGNTLSCS